MWMDTPLRRADRALAPEAAEALLQTGSYGVLATADAEGLPLATPLNYVLLDGALYFHCAAAGHKMQNLAARPQVCFCVVGEAQPVFHHDFTTRYESVLAFGNASLVEDDGEKTRVLAALCEKYLPTHMAQAPAAIAQSLARTAIVRIEISRVSGKANRAGGT
ncbi:MAG: pyridoxamine 5'-phosphate oxidase family protein [Ruminococcaceae bacterium]|nr:pyridoxamine 5'-phosphate oxidase family protein [Oscillospiraceae bacterium]